MQLKKAIKRILEKNATRHDVELTIAHADFDPIVDQILSLIQPNTEIAPPLNKANVMQAAGDPLAVMTTEIQKLRDSMQKVLDNGDVCSRSGKSYSTGFIAALDKVLGIVSATANGA